MKDRALSHQRVGAIYLMLTLAGCGGALALASGYRLGAATAASAMLPSLATVYLAWASFRADRSEATSAASLEQVADELAAAVATQWRAESHNRRLHEPYPLPVNWSAAPTALVEDWPVIEAMANSWPEPRREHRDAWAHEPSALTGQWEQIQHVLTRQVPTGRLLVLGEPGAGKSVLLIHLVQQLAHQRDGGGRDHPVPVLFTLASWNPANQQLSTWMARYLERDYPVLRHSAAAHDTTWAQALLGHGLILPILDGFDELPARQHPAALDAINQFLLPGQGIVLSSRIHDYHQAITHHGAARLAGAAGIQLQPVQPAPAAAYLTQVSARPDRWTPVITQLGGSSPVARALSTPQMLFLARTLYSPRPGQHDHTGLPDPAELCARGRFPTVRAVEEYLLRSFIPAVYRPATHGAELPFSAQQAERALVFLAGHLQRTAASNPDIAWWQLPEVLPRRIPILARWAATALITALRVTLPASLTAALAYSLLHAIQGHTWAQTPRALAAGSIGAITAALACALAAAAKLATRSLPDQRGWTTGLVPLRAVRWHWDTRAIALALTCATVLATAATLLLTGTIGATLAAPLGVTAVIWGGTRIDNADPSTASTPSALLQNEQSTILRNGLILATLGALTTAILYAWRVQTDAAYSVALLTGAAAGIIVGLFAGLFGRLSELASWSFTATRHYLAAHHHLPRDLMAFLADAHQQRGVLRQIGGVYQFRHPDLQRTFATTHEKTTPPGPDSSPYDTDTE